MRIALIVALGAGCAESVSPDPLGDYTTWKRIDVTGKAPGHADSYRIIYANDRAADPAQSFVRGYQSGSIIVKEIRENDAGRPGAIRYVAIMRRESSPTDTLGDEAGWLFTQAGEPGGSEVYKSLCWNRCHVAAPYAGAWYDYRK